MGTGLCNLTFLINITGDCFEEVFRVFVQKRSRKLEEERTTYIEEQIKRANTNLKVKRFKKKNRGSSRAQEEMMPKGDNRSTMDDELSLHGNTTKRPSYIYELKPASKDAKFKRVKNRKRGSSRVQEEMPKGNNRVIIMDDESSLQDDMVYTTDDICIHRLDCDQHC